MDTLLGSGSVTGHGLTISYNPTGGFLGGPKQVGTFRFDLSGPEPRSIYVLVDGADQITPLLSAEYNDAIERYRK